jgi:hypothetical protein
VACLAQASNDGGGSASEGATDAGADVVTGEAGTALRFASVAQGFGTNLACLAQPLPGAGAGESACAILLEGLSVDCTAAGLSPPTSGEVALLTKNQPLPDGSTCELTQVTGATGAGCSAQLAPGWCYVAGPCTADASAACQHAVCTTAGFDRAFAPAIDSGPWTAVLLCP